MPLISLRFLRARMASTAALPAFILSETFFSACMALYSESTLLYAASSSASCFSSSDSLRLASRMRREKSSRPGPASFFSCSRLHLASLISKSMLCMRSSNAATLLWASSDSASRRDSSPWADLRPSEHESISMSSSSRRSCSCLCSPPVFEMASETSSSSASASSCSFSWEARSHSRSATF